MPSDVQVTLYKNNPSHPMDSPIALPANLRRPLPQNTGQRG